mgnify:CR=1 FL=1|tara:strand:- start:2696 stop:2956 length:261 start_codon:yes stop_codon:yes gene_type:complete
MAFKMKGFPLRSGFTHTVNIDKHEHIDAAEDTNETTDDHMDVQFTPREKQHYISEIESYHGIKFNENNPQHLSLLRSFKKPQPGNE